MTATLTPFHLAIPVDDLELARSFYRETLHCKEGRSSTQWVDFNFFGHQLVIHLAEKAKKVAAHNPVDGHHVPVPHFGVVLTMPDWLALRDRLIGLNIQFELEPYIRFEGQSGEQATMFFYDPCGNALEFKAFKNMQTELFRK